MGYRGSEAERLDYAGRAWGYEATRPYFDVVEGGGADARTRQGNAAQAAVFARLVVLAVVAFVVLGAARVAITAATVSHLCINAELQTKIADAEELNGELRVERSVLSNSTRITRIATENYGMVHASSHDHLSLYTEEKLAEMQAEAEAEGDASDEAKVAFMKAKTANSSVTKAAEKGARAIIAIENEASGIVARN